MAEQIPGRDWRDRELDPRRSEVLEKEQAQGQVGAASRPYSDEEKLNEIFSRPYSDEEKLNEIFSYHPPNFEQTAKYEHIREAARHFAKVLLMNTPAGPDRTTALRHIRDAVMTANSAVSLNGLSF